MIKPISILTAATTTLLLAACSEEAAEPEPTQAAGDNRTAKGEVLGGTISDEMLPLDTVQSQSPSLAGEAGEAGDEGDSDDTDADAE